jgi:hypothetical protein
MSRGAWSPKRSVRWKGFSSPAPASSTPDIHPIRTLKGPPTCCNPLANPYSSCEQNRSRVRIVGCAPRNDGALDATLHAFRDSLSSPFRKNFPLSPSGKSLLEIRAFRADKRGVSRSSRHVGLRNAMDAVSSARRAAPARTAKPRGSDVSTLTSSSWEADASQG